MKIVDIDEVLSILWPGFDAALFNNLIFGLKELLVGKCKIFTSFLYLSEFFFMF